VARVWGREGGVRGVYIENEGYFWNIVFAPVVGLLYISKQKPKYFITSK
jgi:hypothetical protein